MLGQDRAQLSSAYAKMPHATRDVAAAAAVVDIAAMLQLICTPAAQHSTATVAVAVAALHAAESEPKVPPHCPLSAAAATSRAPAAAAAATARARATFPLATRFAF